MKNVLVTGGNGFIGSWLCKNLVENNAEVTAMVYADNEMFQKQGIADSVKVVIGDIGNREEIEKAFSESKPDVCFHLAAKSTQEQVVEDEKAAFETNVEGTRNVLEEAKKYGSAIVFISTARAYGDLTEECVDEEQPLIGTGQYAKSKIAAENVCREFSKDVSIGIARLTNVFGGYDSNYSRLVPSTVRNLLAGKPAQIYGKGESLRDMLYIEDVVEGLLMLGQKALSQKLEAEAFNIASGNARSLKEVVEEISKILGKSIEPEFSGEEANTREVLCIEKAEKQLIADLQIQLTELTNNLKPNKKKLAFGFYRDHSITEHNREVKKWSKK